MLISPAYAQAAGGGGSGIEAFLPLILIFVIFYFLLIRPQQKKMKEHKAMLESVRRGDKVVTGGGIVGTVSKVGEGDDLTVEIAEDVKITVRRSMLSAVESKSAPQKSEGSDAPANDAGGEGEKKQSGLRALFGGGKKDA